MNPKSYVAEAIGTFWLTFGGCGSAVIAAGFPQVGIGLLGVSLAFGLTVVTMAYAIGHISGCHLNPAVTVGLTAGGRFPVNQVIPYIVAQVAGAVAAAALLYVIASGAPGFDLAKGFASNGYGDHSPGHYDLMSAFITEVVMTMMFLFVIMGATHGGAGGLCAAGDRARADADPSGQHSGHQYLGQSGPQHRSRAVRRRRGAVAALAVLGGAADRRDFGRRGLSLAEPRAGRPRDRQFAGNISVKAAAGRPAPRRQARRPIGPKSSVQPEFAIDGADFGGLDQLGMRHGDRMQRSLELFQPEIEEFIQPREVRAEVIVLPDISL
jgi:glycerol uptake facilitator-like aquaporin